MLRTLPVLLALLVSSCVPDEPQEALHEFQITGLVVDDNPGTTMHEPLPGALWGRCLSEEVKCPEASRMNLECLYSDGLPHSSICVPLEDNSKLLDICWDLPAPLFAGEWGVFPTYSGYCVPGCGDLCTPDRGLTCTGSGYCAWVSYETK